MAPTQAQASRASSRSRQAQRLQQAANVAAARDRRRPAPPPQRPAPVRGRPAVRQDSSSEEDDDFLPGQGTAAGPEAPARQNAQPLGRDFAAGQFEALQRALESQQRTLEALVRDRQSTTGPAPAAPPVPPAAASSPQADVRPAFRLNGARRSALDDLSTAASKRTELKAEANVVNHGVCDKAVEALREAQALLTEPVDTAAAATHLAQGANYICSFLPFLAVSYYFLLF